MTDPLESNAYAVAYRLLGSAAAAHAVANSAAARVRERFAAGGGLDPDVVASEVWLPMLIDFTIALTVRQEVAAALDGERDEFAGLREALRRRLVRASRQERVVSALVHLCGYSEQMVAGMLHSTEPAVRNAARILDPPPGIDYRDLGDPDLVGRPHAPADSRLPIPYPSTIAVAAVLLLLVIVATRCRGPRPTLVDEGSLRAPNPVVTTYGALRGQPLGAQTVVD